MDGRKDRMNKAPWRAALVLAAIMGAAIPSKAGDAVLLLGGGIGNLRHPPRQAYGSLELTYKMEDHPWGLWTAAEAGGTEKYVGLGLYLAWPFKERWTFAISSGPGWYSNRGTFNLGSELEFRSTAYLMYRWGRRSSVGISVSHYSNGGIARHNPGAESVRIFVGIPLGRGH